jgi:hypothetical protein
MAHATPAKRSVAVRIAWYMPMSPAECPALGTTTSSALDHACVSSHAPRTGGTEVETPGDDHAGDARQSVGVAQDGVIVEPAVLPDVVGHDPGSGQLKPCIEPRRRGRLVSVGRHRIPLPLMEGGGCGPSHLGVWILQEPVVCLDEVAVTVLGRHRVAEPLELGWQEHAETAGVGGDDRQPAHRHDP